MTGDLLPETNIKNTAVYKAGFQAGIDEAVETERNRIKEWVLAQVNEGSGQCIHYGEILEALQDQK